VLIFYCVVLDAEFVSASYRKTPAKLTENGSSIATGKSPDFTWSLLTIS
jgi:hypothetical protein